MDRPRLDDRFAMWRAGAAASALILCWEVGGRVISEPQLFPWPSYLALISFPSLAIFGGAANPDAWIAAVTVLANLGVTLSRICTGLALGLTCGVMMGFGVFGLTRLCSGESPLLVLLRSFPLFSLIPLFVFWFAGSEAGVWLYIAFSTSCVVASGIFQAILNVPRIYLTQAKLLGASRVQQIFSVVVPAIMPELVATARNVLGLSWAFSLGAEYTATRDGLGHLVYLSYTYADMGKLAVMAVIYSLGGLVVFFLWGFLVEGKWAWAKSK